MRDFRDVLTNQDTYQDILTRKEYMYTLKIIDGRRIQTKYFSELFSALDYTREDAGRKLAWKAENWRVIYSTNTGTEYRIIRDA